MSRIKISILLIFSLIVVGKAHASADVVSTPPTFEITQPAADLLPLFDRQIEVFGIPIYADSGISKRRLLHAANIFAQYLDNDEDGNVDSPLILEAMHKNDAFLVMWSSEERLEKMMEAHEQSLLKGYGQDLGNDETRPEWHAQQHTGRFDASIEEIWHLITSAGYAEAYPEIFGIEDESALTRAMDKARGGHFTSVPSRYPDTAWFTYYDDTCNYEGMAVEYIYWGMTSILGAQSKRAHEINDEWRLYKKEYLERHDPALYKLLTTKKYSLPQKLPDGNYRGFFYKK